MIPLERIKRVNNKAPFFERHGYRPVLIWSGQWGAWWRPNAKGYTTNIEEAGVYSLKNAYERSGHAGPEKQISFDFYNCSL